MNDCDKMMLIIDNFFFKLYFFVVFFKNWKRSMVFWNEFIVCNYLIKVF